MKSGCLRACALLCFACAHPHGLGAVAVDPAIPAYAPCAVAFPEGASYVSPDHAIVIVGYNDMDGILARLDALFARTHPGFKFQLVLKGTRTAPPALARGASAFAPMGAPISSAQLAAYEKVTGAAPLGFRIAHASTNPRAKSGPIGFFVARGNPLTKLTTAQIARLFAPADSANAITTWGQLGLGGTWRGRPLHVCGLKPESALGEYMLGKLHARQFAPDYAGFPESFDVIAHIGRDPLALGFAALNHATAAVKLIAIATTPGGPWLTGTPAEIVSGHYPYDRFLYLYVRRPPDPFVREYLRLVFSREGQAAISASARGYLPLNAREGAAELARLDAPPP